ncbi:sulfotransferase domain-containing protein [Azospirillum sp.]|uniref:sulfotransferase domain-containing protein n=1 Tax=Azospirillum sp. TaxID=34012 RepID=UPI002D347263|nr:sulfotransferase domain-containing protein [Azospirillum sp.]HYD64570.1 sulfotransferase domain-containing protein [Azospirillum sp.]
MANPNIIKCWIASYPRSGNTFARIAIALTLIGDDTSSLDKDIPEFSVHVGESLFGGSSVIKTDKGQVRFIKTHFPRTPNSYNYGTDIPIYIYRHPLDVFLSGLNYIYLNSQEPAYSKYFLNAFPKAVGQIIADGEMKHYFDRFLEDEGLSCFEPLAGKWSENIAAWHSTISSTENGLFVDYSYVTGRPFDFMQDVLRLIGRRAVDHADLARAVDRSLDLTKPNGKFYWRAKSGAHREMLRPEWIAAGMDRFGPTLSRLGLDFALPR